MILNTDVSAELADKVFPMLMTREDTVRSLESGTSVTQSPDAVARISIVPCGMGIELIEVGDVETQLTIRLHPSLLAPFPALVKTPRPTTCAFLSLPLASNVCMCYMGGSPEGRVAVIEVENPDGQGQTLLIDAEDVMEVKDLDEGVFVLVDNEWLTVSETTLDHDPKTIMLARERLIDQLG